MKRFQRRGRKDRREKKYEGQAVEDHWVMMITKHLHEKLSFLCVLRALCVNVLFVLCHGHLHEGSIAACAQS